MKYLILIIYAIAFSYVPDLLGYEMHVAFVGGLIRAVGAGKMAKNLQGKADALNPVRPEYMIPQEVQDYLNNAMNQAGGDMPGYGRMLDQAYGNTANTLEQARGFASSGNDLLQTLSGVSATERRNVNDINTQNQGFRASGNSVLNQALMQMAGYQDQSFDYNKNQPYIQEEADKRAFQEGALNQKAAATDAWASFGDGLVNTAMTVMGAPTGAGGGSMFGKLFGK